MLKGAKGRTRNWREVECEPPPEESEGKPRPKGEGGGEPPQKEKGGRGATNMRAFAGTHGSVLNLHTETF